jgi:hypothetical protein
MTVNPQDEYNQNWWYSKICRTLAITSIIAYGILCIGVSVAAIPLLPELAIPIGISAGISFYYAIEYIYKPLDQLADGYAEREIPAFEMAEELKKLQDQSDFLTARYNYYKKRYTEVCHPKVKHHLANAESAHQNYQQAPTVPLKTHYANQINKETALAAQWEERLFIAKMNAVYCRILLKDQNVDSFTFDDSRGFLVRAALEKLTQSEPKILTLPNRKQLTATQIKTLPEETLIEKFLKPSQG